jgi:NAD(P)-dependent dehydrogenase (short-subunit alcohol dehydrogenase family)
MDLGLAGKAAIVNGASQGIGYAIAHLLAEEGARVAGPARRTPALDGAAERIRNETGAEVIAVQGDVRNPDDCERIVADAVAGFGRLDILVNNDGAPPLGAALDFDDAAWLQAVAQNLLSVVRMSRAAVPHIRRAGGGSILNIAALSMLQPIPGFGLSVASWAGVMGSCQDAVARTGKRPYHSQHTLPWPDRDTATAPRHAAVGPGDEGPRRRNPAGPRRPGRRDRRSRRLSRLTPRRLRYRRHAPSRWRAIAQPTLMRAGPSRYCSRAAPGSDYQAHLDLSGNRLRHALANAYADGMQADRHAQFLRSAQNAWYISELWDRSARRLDRVPPSCCRSSPGA